jgi:hypothetical protein
MFWTRAYWQRRAERRFVAEVLKRLGDKDRLYIHPGPRSGATVVITPYDPLPEYNHAHLEGDSKERWPGA